MASTGISVPDAGIGFANDPKALDRMAGLAKLSGSSL